MSSEDKVEVTLTIDAGIWAEVLKVAVAEGASDDETAQWMLELVTNVRENGGHELGAYELDSAARGAPWPSIQDGPASDPKLAKQELTRVWAGVRGFRPDGIDWH